MRLWQCRRWANTTFRRPRPSRRSCRIPTSRITRRNRCSSVRRCRRAQESCGSRSRRRRNPDASASARRRPLPRRHRRRRRSRHRLRSHNQWPARRPSSTRATSRSPNPKVDRATRERHSASSSSAAGSFPRISCATRSPHRPARASDSATSSSSSASSASARSSRCSPSSCTLEIVDLAEWTSTARSSPCLPEYDARRLHRGSGAAATVRARRRGRRPARARTSSDELIEQLASPVRLVFATATDIDAVINRMHVPDGRPRRRAAHVRGQAGKREVVEGHRSQRHDRRRRERAGRQGREPDPRTSRARACVRRAHRAHGRHRAHPRAHRRCAAPGDDPARTDGPVADLPHQGHVRHEHRRAAQAARRPARGRRRRARARRSGVHRRRPSSARSACSESSTRRRP